MNTKNNHQNLEICPRCGNWARHPKDKLCPRCYRGCPVTAIPMIITSGKITLSNMRKELEGWEKLKTELLSYALTTARQQVIKEIGEDTLYWKRPISDLNNCEEEVKTRFKQLREKDEELKEISRAINGISWAIKSLRKFLAELEQKNNKTLVVV